MLVLNSTKTQRFNFSREPSLCFWSKQFNVKPLVWKKTQKLFSLHFSWLQTYENNVRKIVWNAVPWLYQCMVIVQQKIEQERVLRYKMTQRTKSILELFINNSRTYLHSHNWNIWLWNYYIKIIPTILIVTDLKHGSEWTIMISDEYRLNNSM